jgi:hypothetical protein
VRAFVPEREKAGAALFGREVYKPELAFKVVVRGCNRPGWKLGDRAGRDDAAEAGDAAWVKCVDDCGREGSQATTKPCPESDP